MKQSRLICNIRAMTLLFASALLVFAGPAAAGKHDHDREHGKRHDVEKIVIHIKVHQEDLQGAIIGMRLATLMQSKGADTTVFLTLRGVRIADNRVPQDLYFGRDTEATLGNIVHGYLGAGGKIGVCPVCGHEIGLEPGYLIGPMEQVSIFSPEEIAELFFEADKILDF
jgi:predicted peroxiredoxin